MGYQGIKGAVMRPSAVTSFPDIATAEESYADLLKWQRWERDKVLQAYEALREVTNGETYVDLKNRHRRERDSYLQAKYRLKAQLKAQLRKEVEREIRNQRMHENRNRNGYRWDEVKGRPAPYRVYGGTKHWPAFKVARWRMEGKLGSHSIWFDGKSTDSVRMIESLRLLIIKEYKEKFGDVDCEPEVAFIDVPKVKDKFLDFLNQYCSK